MLAAHIETGSIELVPLFATFIVPAEQGAIFTSAPLPIKDNHGDVRSGG